MGRIWQGRCVHEPSRPALLADHPIMQQSAGKADAGLFWREIAGL
jgi:hypothetical protein